MQAPLWYRQGRKRALRAAVLINLAVVLTKCIMPRASYVQPRVVGLQKMS